MIDAKATSDDEDSGTVDEEGRPIFWIKKREERSVEAELWIRMLDFERERYARLLGKRWRQRVRVVPAEGQKTSKFPALSQGRPVDYFDPVFFNKLPSRLRSIIAIQKIALHPDTSLSFTKDADEHLSDVEIQAITQVKSSEEI